ncbi:hypothetical protein CHUAL_002048 [Chamberlinius hualienensis]
MKIANCVFAMLALVVMTTMNLFGQLDITKTIISASAAAVDGSAVQVQDKARAFRIKPKPCWDKKGVEGTCMFQWECHRRNGTMLSTCIDKFLFGSCCYLTSNDTSANSTVETKLNLTSVSPISISTTAPTFIIGPTTENVNDWNNPNFVFTPEVPEQSTTSAAPSVSVPTPNINQIFEHFLGNYLANFSDKVETTSSTTTQLVTLNVDNQTISTTTQSTQTSSQSDIDGVEYDGSDYHYDLLDETTSQNELQSSTVSQTLVLGSLTTLNVNVVETLIPSTMVTTSEATTTTSTIPTTVTTSNINKVDVDLNMYGDVSDSDVYSDINDYPNQQPVSSTTEKPTTTTVTTTTKRPLDYKKECGVRPLVPNGRIVGGTSSRFGEWPWQVLIKEATWLGLFVKNKCGGVLINHRYVITAAHCQPSFLASLLVVFGESDLSEANQEMKPLQRNVRRVVVHRKFNSLTFDNDLALLELDRPVEYKPHIVPICLPDDNIDLTDQVAIVSGWGRLKYGGRLPTGLQHVEVPIIPNRKCQQMFLSAGHLKGLGDKFICAGYKDGGKDSCEGDSGGPLMLEGNDGRWILIGTVSHGIKCAYPNLPGVYINIAAYKSWILKVINS